MTKSELIQYLHRKIETIDDEVTLLQIEEIIHIIINGSKVRCDSLSEELKFTIDKGIKQLDEGKFISYGEIRKNILNDLKND